jgi:hypothetical protein
MAEKNQNMLAEFISCILRFAWKLFLWTLWAVFRVLELISQGIATYIKNQLTN